MLSEMLFLKLDSILTWLFFSSFLPDFPASLHVFWFSLLFLFFLSLSVCTPLICSYSTSLCSWSSWTSEKLLLKQLQQQQFKFLQCFAFSGSWLARWKCKFPWSDSFHFFVLLCSRKISLFRSLSLSTIKIKQQL